MKNEKNCTKRAFFFIVSIFCLSFFIAKESETIGGTKTLKNIDGVKESGQDALLWSETWYDDYSAEGNAVWKDENYVFTCGTSHHDMVIIKWDALTGEQIWNNTWSAIPLTDVYGCGIYGNSDSVFTCGGIYPNALILVKWNAETGVQIWNRTFIKEIGGYGQSVWCDDLHVYVCGAFNENTYPSYSNMMLIKWDINGNKIWDVSWGGNEAHDRGDDLWGHGIYLYSVGTTESFGAGGRDMVIVKWDATTGMQVWNRTWGGVNDENAVSIYGNGTSIFTVGSTNSFGDWLYNNMIVKWDTNGTQVWNVTNYGVFHGGYGGVWCDDTFVFTTGSIYTSFYPTVTELLLIKWNATSGVQVWNKTFYGRYDAHGHDICCDETSIFTVGFGSKELLLVKWNNNGDIPEADFTIDSNTPSEFLNITFTAQITHGDDGIVAYYWDFGDGSFSSLATPVHQYLKIGLYSVNLTIIDSDGDSATNYKENFVNVATNTAPDISYGATRIPDGYNVIYNEGDVGNEIFWTVRDETINHASYDIFMDGIKIENGTWNSGVTFRHNIDSLNIGNHNCTIFTFDGYGQVSCKTVIIHVIKYPEFYQFQNITTYQGGKTTIILEILVDDWSDVYTYEIYENDIGVHNGTNENGVPIQFDANTTVTGFMMYLIHVTDSFGNVLQNILVIDVLPGYAGVPSWVFTIIFVGIASTCIFLILWKMPRILNILKKINKRVNIGEINS